MKTQSKAHMHTCDLITWEIWLNFTQTSSYFIIYRFTLLGLVILQRELKDIGMKKKGKTVYYVRKKNIP